VTEHQNMQRGTLVRGTQVFVRVSLFRDAVIVCDSYVLVCGWSAMALTDAGAPAFSSHQHPVRCLINPLSRCQ